MDARPTRQLRPMPSLGNENWAPITKQPQLHQRHKSTGNLVNMPANGGLQAAAKRTALADNSNTSRVPLQNASKGATKGKGSVLAVLKESNQPTNSLVQQPQKAAFARPAQRPQSKASIASIVNPIASSRPVPQRDINKAVPRSRQNTVYSDAQAGVQAAKSEVRGVEKSEEHAAQLEEAPSAVVPLSLPRPSPSAACEPATNINLDPIQQLLLETARVTEGVQQPIEIEETCPVQESLHPDDDDLPEAAYMDAMEELPQIDRHTVEISSEDRLESETEAQVKKLDISIKADNKMVDFDCKQHIPYDEAHDISDYEDDDYYDDQGYTTAHSFRSRGDTTTGGTFIGPPRVTKRDLNEIAQAKKIVESTITEEEIEEENWDISMVAEYGEEIFGYARQLESSMLPSAYYMDIQTEIQWSMRSVLMDWVVQVHARFGLLPETLFLTTNYIDRFLSCKVISLGKLQLVGATAILIAAKYEEINCPSISEIVYMVDGGYTADEIIKAERFMLSMLNFELGWPGPMSFLRRISKADDYDLETRTLSKYFLEVALMDERFVASPPSFVAAGSHCLARLMLRKGDWSDAHVHYSGYTFGQLKPLVGLMLDCCRIARKHHAAVYDKYADKRYKRAATYVEGELLKGFVLDYQRRAETRVSVEFTQEQELQLSDLASQPPKMGLPAGEY